MVKCKCLIEKFGKMGEKTGWTYITIPKNISQKINPGINVSYRVKGFLDQLEIKGTSLLPMGKGDFILPLNLQLRKLLKKKQGDQLLINVELDREEYTLDKEFMEALETDPLAFQHFNSMPRSHQNYYSKWIESAKTHKTKMDRMVRAVISLAKKEDYGTMLRNGKEKL